MCVRQRGECAAQVRHNEDKLNVELSARVRWQVDAALCDLPHTKANLLFQAHLGRTPLPLADYITDTKLTLDNAIRLLQAMIDTAASQGWLDTTLACLSLLQVRCTALQHLRCVVLQRSSFILACMSSSFFAVLCCSPLAPCELSVVT